VKSGTTQREREREREKGEEGRKKGEGEKGSTLNIYISTPFSPVAVRHL